MSVSTIYSRFGTFTITTSDTSVNVYYDKPTPDGITLASLELPDFSLLEPATNDTLMSLYLAAVDIVNTKIKDLADAAQQTVSETLLTTAQSQLTVAQSQLTAVETQTTTAQSQLTVAESRLAVAKNPPSPQLTSYQRASLVNSLKASGQIDSIVKEIGNPTAIPGLPIPPDIKKF